ncbi:MAG: hypothetical protein JWM89_10, partial [Acidimicrobiales bacterium]|nr:hypothetical protein [Acidimicrobiales bacterium]
RPLRLVSVVAGALSIFGILVYVGLPLDGVLEGAVHRTTYTDAATNTVGTKSSFLLFHTTAVNPAPGWSNYNYSGLESKPASPPGCDAKGSTTPCVSGGWTEYRNLVRTMAGLGRDAKFGCGRSMWEYDKDRVSGYGTPMALMMLPYFTDGCIGSQEGLYFESSTTVPYHFFMQAELSASGSGPQRDVVYPGFDIDAGVRHLQLLGVKYYLASSSTAVNAASTQPDLTEVAVSGAWHVYEVADAATVTPLEVQPVVAEGMGESQDDWLPTASAWFLDGSDLDVPVSDSGPKEWKRVQAKPVPTDWRRSVIWARSQLGLTGAIDQVPKLPRVKLPSNRVSHIEMGRDTISFDVSRPGVPVLVKTSYFPNWEASGADGPYRVTPNLMVVIPHSKHVSLHYGRTPVDLLGAGMTVLGLVALIFLVRQPPIAVPADRQGRVSRWLDEVITIPPLEKAPRRRHRSPDDPDGDGMVDHPADDVPAPFDHMPAPFDDISTPVDRPAPTLDGLAPSLDDVPAPLPPADEES